MERITSASGNPINYVAQAFDARTNQLETQRLNEEKQRDNDIHKIFEYAGDGHTEEAKYYARQKNIEIPDDVLGNADFMKGAALSKTFYEDDPAAGQKFALAWISNRDGDLLSRINAASQVAGPPRLKPSTLEQKIAMELWKEGRPKEPPISRYEAGVKAYNAAMQGAISPDPKAFEDARQKAMTDWDNEFNPTYAQPAQPSNISSGLVGAEPAVAPPPSGAQNWQAQPTIMPDIAPVTPTQPNQQPISYQEYFK